MDIIVKYIDELLEKSTPEAPMWNIEKIKQPGRHRRCRRSRQRPR